jgi:hypothetical protein
MPQPKLSISIRNSSSAIDKLHQYKRESEALQSKFQHFIAEIIMLRLFSIFEETVAEIAYKLAAGANYTNGNPPALHQQAGSISGARSLFLSYGRRSPVQSLKWTKARYIRESVQHVISSTDPLILNAQYHGNTIDEMRKVRNVLAHNTSSAKSDYRNVVISTYGARVNITPGAFLSTTRRATTANIDRYLIFTKIVLNDMASGH